jgi:uncharacterized protein (DUF885 family)
MTTIDELAAEHWRSVLTAAPTMATLFGVHDYDHLLDDLTADGEQSRRSEIAQLLSRVSAAVPADDREAVVRSSLHAVLDEQLTELGGADGRGVSHQLLRCEQMEGPHQLLLQLMPNLTYPEPAHATAVVKRYQQAGAMLEQAADRFTEALELGLTPVARNVQHVLGQLDGFLDSPLADDPLIAVQGPADWCGEHAWRASLTEAVSDHVRPALAVFRDRLAAEQLPRGRSDYEAGLVHVDPSGEAYRSIAKVMTTVDVDPDALHAVGVDYVTGPLADEWAALGDKTMGESDPFTLMRRMREDPIHRYGTPAEMEQHGREAVARAAGVMGDWFGRLPVAACVVAPVPAYLSSSMAPAYYVQAAPDGTRPGTYFVNSADVGSMLRTEGEATAFHEAIPGHHLQLAISAELDGVPDFLRYGAVIAYAEGWGLYAERLADEMGLYSSDHDRLGMLSLDAFRAARLVVDTGIHAMGWSRQKAIDWMTTHTPIPHATIATEVDRYIAIPGQALSYKLGQLEIMRLRADAEARLGDRFDVRGFHDAVLGHGMLPLPVLGEVIDRWTSSQLA